MENNIILNKYKIIKTIEQEGEVSLYLVEDRETGGIYALKTIPAGTSVSNYDTVVKEFNNIIKKYATLTPGKYSPAIVRFVIQDSTGYLIVNYTDEDSIKAIKAYPSIGKILNNRYVVVQGIATGGFGVVYLVRDLSLPGKYWALKELHDEGAINEICEKSFRVEAEMLSKLEHPAIPRISDFFSEGKKLYLIMDYIQGETLKKLLANQGENKHLTEEDVVKWTISICDVLHYLHTRTSPIVFRDLKPENIMLTQEGNIKLIDFGIARVFQGPKNDTTKYALLTEGYAPPEQWVGKAEPRSDIYSLGATIFHLLSGIHPKKVIPDFPPVENYNPGVSPHLSQIIKKALETKISGRFSSIKEMQEELIRVLNKNETEQQIKEHIEKAKKFEEQKDYFNANFEYMKAIENGRENPEILTGLAICCEHLNFPQRATDYYKKALTFSISEDLKKNIQKSLERLALPVEEEKTIPVLQEIKSKGPKIKIRTDKNAVNKMEIKKKEKGKGNFLYISLGCIITIITIIIITTISIYLLWILSPSILEYLLNI